MDTNPAVFQFGPAVFGRLRGWGPGKGRFLVPRGLPQLGFSLLLLWLFTAAAMAAAPGKEISAGPWASVGPIPPGEADRLETGFLRREGTWPPSVGILMESWLDDRALHLLPTPTSGVASDYFLSRTVECPEQADAYWFYGVNGTCTIWLNGVELVRETFRIEGNHPWQVLKVALEKGQNRLLIRIGGAESPTGFLSDLVVIPDWATERRRLLEQLGHFPGRFSQAEAGALLRHLEEKELPICFPDPTCSYFEAFSEDPDFPIKRLQEWLRRLRECPEKVRMRRLLVGLVRKLGLAADWRASLELARDGRIGPDPGRTLTATTWRILGPFPASAAPDLAALPELAGAIPPGKAWTVEPHPHSWYEVPDWDPDGVSHEVFEAVPISGKPEICWLGRVFMSSREEEVFVSFGVDDEMEAWLNGRPLMRPLRQKGCHPRCRILRTHFQPGSNTLLLRVRNDSGNMEFSADVEPITDPASISAELSRALQEFLGSRSDPDLLRLLAETQDRSLSLPVEGWYDKSFTSAIASIGGEFRRIGSLLEESWDPPAKEAAWFRTGELIRDLGLSGDLQRFAEERWQAGSETIRAWPWHCLGPIAADEIPDPTRLFDGLGFVDPSRLAGVGGRALEWRAMPEWRDDRERHNLQAAFDFDDEKLFTLVYRNLYCPRDMEVFWYFGVDDYLKGWVNGRPCAEVDQPEECQPRRRVVRLSLRKGANPVFLRLGNRSGEFLFASEFVPIADWPAERDRLLKAIRMNPEFLSPRRASDVLEFLDARQPPSALLDYYHSLFWRGMEDPTTEILSIRKEIDGAPLDHHRRARVFRLAEICRNVGLEKEAAEWFRDVGAGRFGPGADQVLQTSPWWVAGPWEGLSPRGAERLQGKDGGIDTAVPVAWGGSPRPWREVASWTDDADVHDLGAVSPAFDKAGGCLLYRTITSTQDLDVFCYLAADDGFSFWFNGRLVAISHGANAFSGSRQHLVKLRLRRGRNHFFLWLLNTGGAWTFSQEFAPIRDWGAEREKLIRAARETPGVRTEPPDPEEAGGLLFFDRWPWLPDRLKAPYRDLVLRRIQDPVGEIRHIQEALAAATTADARDAARFRLIEFCKQLRIMQPVRTLLHRQIARHPPNPGPAVRQGMEAIYSGRLEEGIRLLRQVTRVAPGLPGVDNLLGICLGWSATEAEDPGLVATARDALRRAILADRSPSARAPPLSPLAAETSASRDRRRAGTFRGQAHLLMSNNQPEQAISFFRRALRLNPWDLESWRGLGAAFRRLGRPADEEASDRRFVARDAELARELYRRIVTPTDGSAESTPAMEPAAHHPVNREGIPGNGE